MPPMMTPVLVVVESVVDPEVLDAAAAELENVEDVRERVTVTSTSDKVGVAVVKGVVVVRIVDDEVVGVVEDEVVLVEVVEVEVEEVVLVEVDEVVVTVLVGIRAVEDEVVLVVLVLVDVGDVMASVSVAEVHS